MTEYITRANTNGYKYEIRFRCDEITDIMAMESLARIIIDVRKEQKEQDKNEQS